MKFTVITICLNSAGFIRRCAQSIAAQIRRPDEYIFVDGGSTDGTLELLGQIRADLQTLGIDTVLLHQEKRQGEAGIPSAWNQGIARATGDVIALLNSDDYYENYTLKIVEDEFSRKPGTELVSGAIRLFDGEGRTRRIQHPKCLFFSEILMPLPHPGCFVARGLYDRLGLYDTKYRISADYDFVWRIRIASPKVKISYLEQVVSNMEIGGIANTSRAAARGETQAIALKYSNFPILAHLAFVLRKICNK